MHLGEAETAAELRAPPGSQLHQDLAHRAYALNKQATHMHIGATVAWWDLIQGNEKMNYECDATLGSPAAVDCIHIRTHQLVDLEVALEVKPGKTRFLSSSQ